MFLAALALSASLVTAAPAPAPAVAQAPQTQQAVQSLDALEGAIFATSCSAEQACPTPIFNGVPVSCTGSTICEVHTYSVRCDNTVIQCTCSTAPANCADSTGYCLCRSYGFSHFQCLSNC